MKTEYCAKHIGIVVKYIKDDGLIIDVGCPTCDALLKPSVKTTHRKLTDEDFTFPEVDDDYINLVMCVLDHGFIEVIVPNEKAISRFDERHKDLKGTWPDRKNAGYAERPTHNEGTYSYTLRVRMILCDGITIDNFHFSKSKDFQHDVNGVTIADNKWCHALLQMGFGLGTDHNDREVLEWIEENS